MNFAASMDSMHEAGGRVAGVATATVTRNDDEMGLGRVKLNLPWRGSDYETDWVRIVTPMGGGDRGLFLLPEVGDEVLVAFDRDDVRYPYVLGALWSDKDKPPEKNSGKKNDVRVLKSRKGHLIKLDDGQKGLILIQLSDGKKVEIDDDGIRIDDGGNKVTLEAKAGTVTIEAQQSLTLKAPQIKIEASASLDLKGGGTLNANAGMVRIN